MRPSRISPMRSAGSFISPTMPPPTAITAGNITTTSARASRRTSSGRRARHISSGCELAATVCGRQHYARPPRPRPSSS
uniref:Uncharacterized protein n=1 Tax=Tanacetum cinerariifolium TaxID=118510 RepID=A0A699XJC1_TANCI|nr:hypothetical protein [Tanacetum cinerariifolium]